MNANSPSSSSGYSPPIRITLEVANERFSVAEMGLDFVVLKTPRRLGRSSGTIFIDVDGQQVLHRVLLPNGIDPDAEDQPLVHLETVLLAKAG